MSSIDQQIAEVEISVEHAKELAAKAAAVRRLAANKDFQLIVDKGYNNDEAVRLAHLVSDPRVDEHTRSKIRVDLESIGAFKRYLGTIVTMGDLAAADIEQAQSELDYLRSDEGRENFAEEG